MTSFFMQYWWNYFESFASNQLVHIRRPWTTAKLIYAEIQLPVVAYNWDLNLS